MRRGLAAMRRKTFHIPVSFFLFHGNRVHVYSFRFMNVASIPIICIYARKSHLYGFFQTSAALSETICFSWIYVVFFFFGSYFFLFIGLITLSRAVLYTHIVNASM